MTSHPPPGSFGDYHAEGAANRTHAIAIYDQIHAAFRGVLDLDPDATVEDLAARAANELPPELRDSLARCLRVRLTLDGLTRAQLTNLALYAIERNIDAQRRAEPPAPHEPGAGLKEDG